MDERRRFAAMLTRDSALSSSICSSPFSRATSPGGALPVPARAERGFLSSIHALQRTRGFPLSGPLHPPTACR
jgi:hypothetical protein